MSLTREQILASPKTEPKPLDVPEWGGTVFIRVMSADESMALGDAPASEIMARMLIAGVCDKNGVPLFTEADVPALQAMEFPAITKAVTQIARVNGLSNKQLEEAVASFGPTPERRDSSE